MRFFATLCLFTLLGLSTACFFDKSEQSKGEVLVKIKDQKLFKEDVEKQIPKNISSSDSLMRAESLVKKWIIDILMFEAAYNNIGNEKNNIDVLVEEYRRNLLRHRYQEYIINDKVSSEISESEKRAYYENNKAQFILSDNLIRGLFLIVPVNAPGLDNVRKWYVSKSDDAIENIEKYSLQNAIIYDYFYDKWVEFDGVMLKMPYNVTNSNMFLRTNNHLEVSDSTHVYFLNISDKLLVGSNAPYEFVETNIANILLNRRKIDYLKDFSEILYRDAVKNGTVKFTNEQSN
jgi:hypothetical protein